jgi:hypothetical protein
VPVDDPLNGCQTDTGPFKRLGPVETLKNPEEFPHVLHIKSDSIVSYENDYLVCSLVQAAYFDLGRRAWAGEFYGVGNQIDQDESEH